MTILITGASSGIGFATAVSLVKQNHHVIAVARSKDKLEMLKNECKKYNTGGLTTLVADISRDGSLSSLQDILDINGPEVLINNAGYLVNKPFTELSRKDWQDVFETNVFSMVAVTQMCIPYLSRSKNAHIINMTSMGGIQGSSKYGGLSAYSSSKGAVTIFTECLAEELKEKNISVNALAMGAVETPMLNKAFPGYKAPVTSEEAAEFISWFALNGKKHFNGKILPVSSSNP